MNTFNARLGLAMLVLANLVTIVSISTPNWMESELGNMGLWVNCTGQKCDSVFDNAHGYAIKDSLIATQCLMSIGQLVILVALVLACSEMCCKYTGCNYTQCVFGFLSIGEVLIGVAVVIFGVTSSRDIGAGNFGWSFWLAVVANVMIILTTLLYQCCSM
ncbi:uncharacterized protein LOC125655520 [Ostrea edulis]|uniref:uncharacterized protein LOC125655520 n=1 Tax=Ostrea edulis TaxID=37623 RepID=UPI0020962616|nr:uncharacterized protein LOC125655520 [Ostrea edulis]